MAKVLPEIIVYSHKLNCTKQDKHVPQFINHNLVSHECWYGNHAFALIAENNRNNYTDSLYIDIKIRMIKDIY